jgi:hypothetical protein
MMCDYMFDLPQQPDHPMLAMPMSFNVQRDNVYRVNGAATNTPTVTTHLTKTVVVSIEFL